jgi:hypothetical protein
MVGAPAKPPHEKSNDTSANASGGWSRTLVMLFGAQMFCSTCSQR